MSRRPALTVLPVALLFCGAVLSVASARAQEAPEMQEWAQEAHEMQEWAQEAVPDHALGAAAWPGLPSGDRVIVEAVARSVWVETGGAPARYDRLPEARKAALRGAALKRLGLDARDLLKGWV